MFVLGVRGYVLDVSPFSIKFCILIVIIYRLMLGHNSTLTQSTLRMKVTVKSLIHTATGAN